MESLVNLGKEVVCSNICTYKMTQADLASPMVQAFRLILLSCFFLTLLACDQPEVDVPPGALEEQTVDMGGTWQLVQAWQNDRDITDRLDFSKIILTLNMDGAPTTFDIQSGGAPFPIDRAGSWSLDDPAYPTQLLLSTDSRQRALSFSAPPLSGDARFSINFSLGCEDNTYTYEFRKL